MALKCRHGCYGNAILELVFPLSCIFFSSLQNISQKELSKKYADLTFALNIDREYRHNEWFPITFHWKLLTISRSCFFKEPYKRINWIFYGQNCRFFAIVREAWCGLSNWYWNGVVSRSSWNRCKFVSPILRKILHPIIDYRKPPNTNDIHVFQLWFDTTERNSNQIIQT